MSSVQTSSSSSSAIIGGNDDLLSTILLFLPAKSLVRFKLVSKRWQSLISDPYFCRRHTANHPRPHTETQPLFFLNNHLSKYLVYSPTICRFFPFTFPLGFSNVRILQSCNGLLLLRCGEKDEERYYVFNPTTMQQRELSPSIPTSRYVDSLYLMFDPSLSLHYRVVCFANTPTYEEGTLIYVYDSETHNWKQLEGEHNRIDSMFRCGTYFNGGIYFVRSDSSSSRFDPDNNVMSNIHYPPDPPLGYKLAYAMESNGYLHCFTVSWNDPWEGHETLNVWEMKGNENIWRNKYRVDINRSLDKSGVTRGCTSLWLLLGMVRGKDEQHSLLLFSLNSKIMIYKFHDDVFEVDKFHDDVFEVDDYTSQEFGNNPHHFIHTIAPV